MTTQVILISRYIGYIRGGWHRFHFNGQFQGQRINIALLKDSEQRLFKRGQDYCVSINKACNSNSTLFGTINRIKEI